MATVIQMPVQRSSRTATVSRPPEGAAILFFTGVRYVREPGVSPDLPVIAAGAAQAETRAVM